MKTVPATPRYPPLRGNQEVDVLVVGAGIAGLTAALLLKRAGKKVVVIDQHEIAGGESGHTTAHVTSVIDSSYRHLISSFGKDAARLAAESVRAGIDRIEQFTDELKIDCSYTRVPAYIYTEKVRDLGMLKQELEAARTVGLSVDWVNDVPLTFHTQGGIRFDHQAQFHPRKYLLALAQAIEGGGCSIHENTRALEMEDGEPCVVQTDQGEVRARDVFVATNTPSSNRVFLHTKVAAYRSYAIAVKLAQPAPPQALYWDTEDPYHYIRSHQDYWIIGGEDHKTGMETQTTLAFEHLIEYAQQRFEVESVQFAWSGQIMEPVDGLPFIGVNSNSRHLYVATGFSGVGMTFGTVSGMLISDLILNRANPWKDLFDATRIKPLSSLKEYALENKDFPLCMVKDRILPADASSVEEIGPGEGKTIRAHGKKLAVYRDESNQLHCVSAVCTHLGCHVHWNNAEKSWDCPCHGSRFGVDGDVLNGPATKALQAEKIEDILKKKVA